MTSTRRIRVGFIGLGAHARDHVAMILRQGHTDVVAVCEPAPTAYAAAAQLFDLVTMNACGNAIPSCHSDIRVFTTKAIIRTGIWGEMLELQRSGAGRLREVRSVAPLPVWEQFLNVRAGREINPSPPEVGLRMARLWDAIRESAGRGGVVVQIGGGQANPVARAS